MLVCAFDTLVSIIAVMYSKPLSVHRYSEKPSVFFLPFLTATPPQSFPEQGPMHALPLLVVAVTHLILLFLQNIEIYKV